MGSKTYRNAGRKRKKPDSAITKLIYDRGMSTYMVHKNTGMSSGQIFNAAKENVTHLTLRFFLRLAYGVHMPVTEVIDKLLKLQEIYPPKVQSRNKYFKQKAAREKAAKRNK